MFDGVLSEDEIHQGIERWHTLFWFYIDTAKFARM